MFAYLNKSGKWQTLLTQTEYNLVELAYNIDNLTNSVAAYNTEHAEEVASYISEGTATSAGSGSGFRTGESMMAIRNPEDFDVLDEEEEVE